MDSREETSEEPLEASSPSDPGLSDALVFILLGLIVVAVGAMLMTGWDFLMSRFLG